MNGAHTPGPWGATEFHEILCAENGFVVAKVPFVDYRLRGKEADEARACIEANKALIAAAPEMLKHLRAASWLLDDLSPFGVVNQGISKLLATLPRSPE